MKELLCAPGNDEKIIHAQLQQNEEVDACQKLAVGKWRSWLMYDATLAGSGTSSGLEARVNHTKHIVCIPDCETCFRLRVARKEGTEVSRNEDEGQLPGWVVCY